MKKPRECYKISVKREINSRSCDIYSGLYSLQTNSDLSNDSRSSSTQQYTVCPFHISKRGSCLDRLLLQATIRLCVDKSFRANNENCVWDMYLRWNTNRDATSDRYHFDMSLYEVVYMLSPIEDCYIERSCGYMNTCIFVTVRLCAWKC